MLRGNHFVAVLALLFVISGALSAPGAYAGLVGAATTLPTHVGVAAFEQALARDDVRAALVAHGVSPELAAARVSALSHAEIASLAKRYEALPAGGVIVEVTLLAFVVWAVLHATDYGEIFAGPDAEKAETK
jgi:hypothetical protein